jgi:hypothetical protein
MSIWIKQHPSLLGGLFLAVLALVGLGALKWPRQRGVVTSPYFEEWPSVLPIDAAQPARTETATFALG